MLLQQGQVPTVPDVEYAIELIRTGQAERLRACWLISFILRPAAKNQAKDHRAKGYLDAIRKNDIVFAIGPAGTGKTYLAMTMAVKALKERTVQRLVLTRPAVEAGENLGFYRVICRTRWLLICAPV